MALKSRRIEALARLERSVLRDECPYYEPAVLQAIEGRLGARSRTIMFPAATHGVFSRGCSGNIVAAFFADPDAVPNAGCVEAMPRIDFIVGGAVGGTPCEPGAATVLGVHPQVAPWSRGSGAV